MAVIEILGEDNHVLIDNSFKNMVLASKLNATFTKFDSSSSTLGGIAEVYFNNAGADWPVMAIRSNFAVAVDITNITNGVAYWRLMCGSDGLNATAEIYIFTIPSKVPNADGIIQMWNESGELIFDSNLRYAKIERQINFRLDNQASVSLPAGKIYALAAVKVPREYTDLPISGGGSTAYRMNRIAARGGIWLNGVIANSRRFEYSNLSYQTFNPDVVANIDFDGSMLVFDVTGMQNT